ncbi:MAG TPA: hypothetical protein VNO26_12565 [Candidatus Limnocylindria bacterium]|nr:hypothetical protein [Candidatus Limnocylindria bacterium]
MPTDPHGGARAVVSRERLHALCAGHFPDDPIVPGAYVAGLLAEVGALAAGRGARLVGIERCTFLEPLRPTEDAVVTAARGTPGPDGLGVACEVSVRGRPVARGLLRFT